MPFASGFVDFLTVIWLFHVKHFFWIMCIPECDFSELKSYCYIFCIWKYILLKKNIQSSASTANVPPNHHAILDHSAVFIWFINRKLIWWTWKISLNIVTISEINVIIIIVTLQSLFVLRSFNSSTWNIYWLPLQFSFKSFLRLFLGLCSTWNFFSYFIRFVSLVYFF